MPDSAPKERVKEERKEIQDSDCSGAAKEDNSGKQEGKDGEKEMGGKE